MDSLKTEAMQTRPMMPGSPQAPGWGVEISRGPEVGSWEPRHFGLKE